MITKSRAKINLQFRAAAYKLFAIDRRGVASLKKIALIAGAIVFLILVVGIGVFVGYSQMKKLPANSFKTIRSALASHDAATFYELVDVDAVLEDAAEEILVDQINQDPTAYSTQQAADRYNNELKPDFISVTKRAVDEYLTSGRVSFDKIAMTNTERWLKRSAINDCIIEGISKPVGTERVATASVLFNNTSLKFSFELALDLEKDEQNRWRVVGAKGFNDYNRSLKRALDKKLAALNAPIYAQLEEICDVRELNAMIGPGDEYGFSQTLKIAMKADVKSSKPLARIVGKIYIGDRDEGNSSPFALDMAYHPTGLQTFYIDKVLNPFVRADVDIMKHGFSRRALHAEIDEVDFLDGSSLKILEQLPD